MESFLFIKITFENKKTLKPQGTILMILQILNEKRTLE